MNPTPSDWARDRLGDDALEVIRRLAEAGLAAHQRAADAHAASGLKQTNAYGATYWAALAEEACSRLAGLAGITPVKPAGSPVKFPNHNGTLLLTVRAQSKSHVGAGTVYLSVSRFRKESLAGGQGTEVQQEFDLGLDENGADIRVQLDAVESPVLVVVDADARQGVRAMVLGQGRQLDDGYIAFSYWEPVDLVGLGLSAKPTTGPRETATSFDTGEIPVAHVQLRHSAGARVEGDADE